MKLLNELFGMPSLFRRKDPGEIYSRQRVEVDVADLSKRIDAISRALSAADRLPDNQRQKHMLALAQNLKTVAGAIEKSLG